MLCAYSDWRKSKLESLAENIEIQRVRLEDPENLSTEERNAIQHCCQASNWALIETSENKTLSESSLMRLCGQLGLKRLDANLKADESGISSVEVKQQRGTRYIPYTANRLSWHTDGYYNDSEHQIRGMVLFCVRQAEQGGESELLDHELLYMKMRDNDPKMIDALMQDDVLTIPANRSGEKEIRPDHSGPVFSVDVNGNLHMRYSARTSNIIWKDDPVVEKATKFITGLFRSPETPIIRYRMKPGEGIISNNVLHRREAFVNGCTQVQQRLFYRARYYDRVAQTDVTTE